MLAHFGGNFWDICGESVATRRQGIFVKPFHPFFSLRFAGMETIKQILTTSSRMVRFTHFPSFSGTRIPTIQFQQAHLRTRQQCKGNLHVMPGAAHQLSNEPPEFADLTVFSPMVWHFWRVSCDMRRVPVLFPEMKSWNKHETHQPMTTYTSQHHYMFIIVAQKSAHIQDLYLSITISDHIWVIWVKLYPIVTLW